jgi:hypothetical protein
MTITEVLYKVGGLLALFKVAVLLDLYHQRIFHNQFSYVEDQRITV